MSRRKKWNIVILTIGVPLLIAAGVRLFHDRRYHLISLAIVLVACLPFFHFFEKKRTDTRTLVVVAVMTALAVTGRFIFAPVPGFKPVTALVILAGMYLGSEAGFLTGALSAVISNMFFGQGPWTPFQMFAWGMIGLIAGLSFLRRLLRQKWILLAYGVFAGVLYSFLMDIWTVLSLDGGFRLSRYLVRMASALPFTAAYAASNVVFLWLIRKPLGDKLERLNIKYGIGG